MYQYPYGNAQQLNLDWLMEQWQVVKENIDGSLQGEIDRVEAAITDLLAARDAAVAAAGAANTSAGAAAASAQAAAADAATATAQAAAATQERVNAAQAANNAQVYAGNAQTQAAAAQNAAGQAAASASQAAADASDAHDDALAASGSAVNAAASAAGALQNFQLSDAARQAAQAAEQDAEAAATLLQPPATPADIGKALIVKTVGGGTVTAYELGESGGGGGTPAIVNTIEDVQLASFEDGTVNPVQQLVVDIEPVQAGSGDPAPDNVRPITGWTGANVGVTGENLCPTDITKYTTVGSYRKFNTHIPNGLQLFMSFEDNDISIDVSDISFGFVDSNYSGGTLPTNSFRWCLNNGTATDRNNISVQGNNRICSLIAYPNTDEALQRLFTRFKIMVSVGNVSKPYTPFNSNSTIYPITFPTEAGTVYYGHIDFSRKKLIADGAVVDLGTLSWTKGTGSYPVTRFTTNGIVNTVKKPLSTTEIINTMCSEFKYVTQAASWNAENIYSIVINGAMYFMTNAYETAEDFKTAVSGIQLVYPLAAPIEYDFEAAPEITLLAGYNNVWADTGNINLLRYYADSKKYIDEQDAIIKALIAPVLDSMVADTALTANDFRIVDNTLYRITAPVAAGAALTPNTNCTATTIGAILKTLLT